MTNNIELLRYNFWLWYFKPFLNDCVNMFSKGPKSFKYVEKHIYDQIIISLVYKVDSIITPTIISYIEENKGQEKSVYHDLFSGNHERTLEVLENFHSATFINIINYYRKFKLHFFQMSERIFSDWKELKDKFNLQDDEMLTDIRLTCGDEHFYGGRTSVLRFAKSTKGFVYKPVSIELDLLMNELELMLYGVKNNIISKARNSIIGEGYGYIGLYEYKPDVKNLSEAKFLYKDFGKLLAWGKFFKIADGHCDNIIVNEEGVKWIDLESAFHFTQDSVYQVHSLEETGLIYDAKHENTYIGIVTGIQGGIIPRLGLTSPTVYKDGTDEMYIRYFKIFTPTNCYNRFFYKDQLCKPENFLEDIKSGYIYHIQYLHENRKKILKYIENFFQTNIIRCRYLIQTTASYARFISLFNHIIALRKENILNIIRKERNNTIIGKENAYREFILDNEFLDITNGIVPYFYRTNKCLALYHASGAFSKNFFSQTLFNDICEHIMSIEIDEEILQEDCEFITKSINSTAGISNFEDFKKRFKFDTFDYESEINQFNK